MRLFIAIDLSGGMKAALTGLQADLRRQGVGGTYTRPENLHLTLAFLGEAGDPEPVLDVLRAVPFRPFPLALEGFGRFGSLYWAGTAPSEPLAAYVRRLRRALAEGGIPIDRKRFSPHITLLRRAEERNGPPRLSVPPAGMEVERISLFRSDRGKNGMLYTELGWAEGTGP